METRTVKATDTVEVSTKEFFGSKGTYAYMEDHEVINNIFEIQNRRNSDTNEKKWFYSEDTLFYIYVIKEERGFSTINEIKPWGCIGGGELWKFGYVTAEGQIVMLFGNHYVAQGRKMARELFMKAQLATPMGCTTFAQKS